MERTVRERNPFISWFAFLVVIFAGLGFSYKLSQFIRTMVNKEVQGFALVPVTTYFVVGIGYLCLFVWSYLQGHYKDVEGPKYRLLEREAELDAERERTGTLTYHD
jgi:nitrogen fixation-related uncharacterized protein